MRLSINFTPSMHRGKEKYTEEQLVKLLREKDRAGFDYLYENYSGALYTVILNIVNDRELAADVLQDSFVKIWKQVSGYDPDKGRLYTWMMRICRNSAIDVVRSRDFRNTRQNVALEESVYGTVATEMKVEHIGIRKWIDKLREEQRIPLTMSYLEGFTHPEIAQKLGLPEGTVKTRIRAGLIQLRSLMSNSG
jgi:RNA polymerase sigma-70 factor (ECF subfamily)